MFDDVLDCFGIDSKAKRANFAVNMPVSEPQKLREIVSVQRNILEKPFASANVNMDMLIDPLTYKKHLI